MQVREPDRGEFASPEPSHRPDGFDRLARRAGQHVHGPIVKARDDCHPTGGRHDVLGLAKVFTLPGQRAINGVGTDAVTLPRTSDDRRRLDCRHSASRVPPKSSTVSISVTSDSLAEDHSRTRRSNSAVKNSSELPGWTAICRTGCIVQTLATIAHIGPLQLGAAAAMRDMHKP